MKITNRSQVEKQIPSKLIVREVYSELLASMSREEVTILYGARQVGKSVQVWQVISKLMSDTQNDVFYFNFDQIPADAQDPDIFINSILSQKIGKKCFVFIDEAQRKDDIGKWIKYMYDQKQDIKWVLTGSASLDLKNKTKESLIGRKIEIHMGPLRINEILIDKGISVSEIKGRFDQLDKTIEDYLRFGGYPAVYSEQNIDRKIEKLTEIAETYLISDLANLYGIKNQEGLRAVATFLAENIGTVLSKDNLAKVTLTTKFEVEKILEALEGGFVIKKIRTFAKDQSRELTHRPKVFFEDLGIRNAILGKLDEGKLMMEKGKLWENLVIILSANKWKWKNTKYWRTINQTEVDVIIVKPDEKLEVYEAKYTALNYTPKNIVSFTEKYKNIIDKTIIVTKDNWWQLL